MKVRAEQLLLFLAVLILDINFLLTNTYRITIKEKVIFLFSAVLIFSLILMKKRIKYDKLKLLYLILIFVNVLQFSWSNMYFNFFLIFIIWLIADSGISTKGICRYIFIISVIGILVWLFMLGSGIITNISYEVYYDGWRIRSTGGFVNVNTFSIYLLTPAILLIMEYGKNFLSWGIAFILVISVYAKSDTRTSIMAFILFGIVYCGLRLLQKMHLNLRQIGGSIKMLLVLPCIISFLSPVLLEKVSVLNKVFSGRLGVNTEFMTHFTIGTVLLGGGGNRYQIDNMYLMLIFNMGICMLLFLFYIAFKVIDQLIYENNIKDIAFLFTCFYIGIMEAIFIKPGFCLSTMMWFIMFSALKRYRQREICDCHLD